MKGCIRGVQCLSYLMVIEIAGRTDSQPFSFNLFRISCFVSSTPPPSTKLSKAMLSSWSVSVRSVPNVAIMRRCTLTVLRYGSVELSRV